MTPRIPMTWQKAPMRSKTKKVREKSRECHNHKPQHKSYDGLESDISATPLLSLFFVLASVNSYVTFVLSLLIPNLFLRRLWKAVLRDCGVFWVSSVINNFSDMNTRVGKEHHIWQGVAGTEDIGMCNSNGLLLCCFMVYSTRRFVLCLSLCYFVIVFFSPLSIAITSLGEERANLSAFCTFDRFALVWFYLFSLPLGVWEALRFVIVCTPWVFLLPFFFFFFFFFFCCCCCFYWLFFYLFLLCVQVCQNWIEQRSTVPISVIVCCCWWWQWPLHVQQL